MRKYIILVLFILPFFFPRSVLAKGDDQFVTIVNPVRISKYNQDPRGSVFSEYSIVKNHKLPATWLLTYDVINYPGMKNLFEGMGRDQELGIFLEVTPKFAADAGVTYSKTEFWHHANALFLSGYTQEERKRLIDKVFNSFKEKFGYYPVSVGSWWTDSFSLSYMKEKYGITGNLGCSDQFATDNYKIWGTYWSTPYYPSKLHMGIPANTADSKIDIVNMQWAARDPLNGYKSSGYSTQDYYVTDPKLDTTYFEKLLDLYSSKNSNQFGQIVVGLEGDLSPDTYKSEYSRQLSLVSKKANEENFMLLNMKDFSNWYRNKFSNISPSQLIDTQDLLGSGLEAIWYQSPKYRLGLVFDQAKNLVKVTDIRVYPNNFMEPYYISPNRQKTLAIQIPSVIDSTNNQGEVWEIAARPEDFVLKDDYFEIKKSDLKIPTWVSRNKFINTKKTKDGETFQINPWIYPSEGLLYKDYSPEARHFFAGKKFILSLILGKGWEYFKKVNYLIPPGELEALSKLRTMPAGKVLVFDNECLQCTYHTQIKPPAIAGIKSYVEKLSGKKIVKNKSVFVAADQQQARKEFKKFNVEYIYLSKFEDYVEKTPFSPGDLGIEKIYENANAEIWRIEKK